MPFATLESKVVDVRPSASVARVVSADSEGLGSGRTRLYSLSEGLLMSLTGADSAVEKRLLTIAMSSATTAELNDVFIVSDPAAA